MSHPSETYPNPTDARLYVDTVAAYSWQMFDVTPFTPRRYLDVLATTSAAIAEQGPAEYVQDQHQYILAPKPTPGHTNVDALDDYPAAYACLKTDDLHRDEVIWHQALQSPRFIFFGRLVVDQVAGVMVGSPNSGHSQMDEAWLEPHRAAEAFARSFCVLTAEAYAAEVRRGKR